MPLDATAVGAVLQDRIPVDARWTMAYAAGLGDHLNHYLDTSRPGGVIAHPLFPVCVEWQANIARPSPGTEGLTPAELARGVHAAHDLRLHRPVRPDATYDLRREVIAVERRSSGAHLVVRTDGAADGEPVWTSYTSTVLRDVGVTGASDVEVELDGEAVPTGDRTRIIDEIVIPVGPTAAHVYSECSRIWNPIHTDVAVARAAGLSTPILHGTATLALATSAVVRRCLDGEPQRVRRIAGRFSGMVTMPTVLTLRVFAPADGEAGVAFEVLDREGHRVMSGGWLGAASPLVETGVPGRDRRSADPEARPTAVSDPGAPSVTR